MGKKIINALTFLIVLGACIVMTVYIGKGSVSTMTYNFVFLGIMTVLYLAGLFMGMFRVDSIAQALKRGTEELAGIFQTPGKVKNDSLTHLRESLTTSIWMTEWTVSLTAWAIPRKGSEM